MRMSWQDIVKEDIEEFPLVDQFRGMLKEFSKQAETIKTPLDMLNLFKEIEEDVIDLHVVKLARIYQPVFVEDAL